MSSLPALKGMRLECDGARATVTFDNPPLNLMDGILMDSLDRLGRWLEQNQTLKVVVFQSADPDFFIAHADFKMLDGLPRAIGPEPSGPSAHQQIVDRFRTLPQVTIGKLAGIARGGGSEFLLALDLRYAAIGRAILSQPEVAFGFPPGCGATQRMPRLVGRSHALEAILGCMDYTAHEAERMGWINRALPPDELDVFVERLAARIASFPRTAILAAKTAIDASTLPLHEGLREEFSAFMTAFASEDVELRAQRAMQRGLQTREVEARSLNDWLADLAIDTDTEKGIGG
jgi:enoyl-CoA hydratase/carnithine racemase